MPCRSFLLNPGSKLQESITPESNPSLKHDREPTALLCSRMCRGDGRADRRALCQQWDELGLSARIPAPKGPEGAGSAGGGPERSPRAADGAVVGLRCQPRCWDLLGRPQSLPTDNYASVLHSLFSPPPARPQPCVLMRAANFTSVLCSR